MSVIVGSNPLLKFGALGLVGLVVVGVISLKNYGQNERAQVALNAENGQTKAVTMKRSSTRLGGEADNAQTSIATLTAQVSTLTNKVTGMTSNKSEGDIDPATKEQLQSMKDELYQLRKNNEELQRKQQETDQNLQPQLATPDASVQPQPVVDSGMVQPSVNPSHQAGVNANQDFGLSDDERPTGSNTFSLPDTPNLINPNKRNSSTASSVGTVQDGDVEWVQPSDAQKVMDKQTNKEVLQLPKYKGNKYTNPAMAKNDGSRMPVAGEQDQEKESSLVPIYTIPENATLISTIGATALIGRIPLNNQVTDPYPFKIVIGRKNLATNGIQIPNLQGMVVSGHARGDFTLKCVYGEINSITYTFIDGTIRTVSAKGESGGKGAGDNGGGSGTGGLGYLSDKQGVPCITGKYITNLPEYLTQLAAINAASGMAEAFAEGQKTTTTNTDGSTTSVINGSRANMNNMLGSGISKGVQSGADALAQRQQGAYDAVYVEPGKRIEVHITKQLDIDYDKKGRKVSHVMMSSRYSGSRGLD